MDEARLEIYGNLRAYLSNGLVTGHIEVHSDAPGHVDKSDYNFYVELEGVSIEVSDEIRKKS